MSSYQVQYRFSSTIFKSKLSRLTLGFYVASNIICKSSIVPHTKYETLHHSNVNAWKIMFSRYPHNVKSYTTYVISKLALGIPPMADEVIVFLEIASEVWRTSESRFLAKFTWLFCDGRSQLLHTPFLVHIFFDVFIFVGSSMWGLKSWRLVRIARKILRTVSYNLPTWTVRYGFQLIYISIQSKSSSLVARTSQYTWFNTYSRR